MGLISSFNSLDKRFAWSFLGFLLAAIFGSITIYTEFFRIDTPSMTIEILNDTNVLDVKEEVNELKIYYGDVDIKSLNQTLSVLFLKVKNTGRAPILNGYYDQKYPLTLTLSDGKFLKVEQIKSTNEYLSSSALPTIVTDQKINLPEIILEPGESYTIKTLVLRSSDSNINLKVLGKIAGVKEIELLKASSDEKAVSYWEEVSNGDVWVQLGRLPIYFFGFILSLVVIIAPIAFASDALSKRKRKIIVKQYKSYDSTELSNCHKVIFEAYIEDSLAPLAQAKEAFSDKDNLKKVLNKKEATSEEEQLLTLSPASQVLYDDIEYRRMGPRHYRRTRTRQLIEKMGAITKTESGENSVNEEIESMLRKFIDFVVIKES